MAENPRIIDPGKKSGWDAPLDVDWNFQVGELRRNLAEMAPAKTGRLRLDIEKPDTVTINEKQTRISIVIEPPKESAPYARIQDEGGWVPPFDIRKAKRERTWGRPYAKVMRAVIGGVVRFFTKRRGFHIRGWNYVDRAVARWWDELCGNPKQTVVRWRGGKAGETFGGIHGRLSE